MGSKNSQLSAAQDALSGGEGEGASRTLAADEAHTYLVRNTLSYY